MLILMMDLFEKNLVNLLPYDGEVLLLNQFIDSDTALKLFEILYHQIAWENDVVKLFGKEHTTKRKVAWYGDEGKNYTYSGKKKLPLKWTNELTNIKNKVEEVTGYNFNSCLLNLYQNGEEGMGWHADNEPELGRQPVIVSISLGSERKFSFRHNTTKARIDVVLNPGSMLIMRGQVQHCWKHALPKSKKVKDGRINLTFRNILPHQVG